MECTTFPFSIKNHGPNLMTFHRCGDVQSTCNGDDVITHHPLQQYSSAQVHVVSHG